ncbi:MAG: CRISPR-associated endonuclease Cas1 [Alphaproteobacteria bacterium]
MRRISTVPQGSAPVLFDRMSSLELLEQGWLKVWRNAGAAGGDGMSVRDFADDSAIRLLRLQRDLRAGTYVPGPVRSVPVPKRSGGVRVLAIPCVTDRVAQTAAALVLSPRLDADMSDASFGYRPGRGVRHAVDRIALHRRAGYLWVVDGDIERYFDSVPHGRLLDRLERSVDDPLVLDLVSLWLESFSPNGLGLPQGAPVSPLLSNLYLDDVDDRIAGDGVRLVRFADDFVLMCRSETAAEAARDHVRALLAEQGLRLNPDKTRIVPFEQGFRFLGHLFVRSLVLKEVGDDDDTVPADLPADLPAALGALAPVAEEAPDDAETADGAPGLRVLYVMEPGRRLDSAGAAFSVTEDGAELLTLPASRLDRIELGPRAEASDEALRQAVASGVSVAWVDGWGRTAGCLHRRPWDRAELHWDQARVALDPAARADLARRLVDGRVRNQRALLNRLNRRRDDAEARAAIATLGRVLRVLPRAADVPTLMGREGEAAAAFWPALGRMLEHGWTLTARRRRPPPDPVNLTLSALAGLLSRDLLALVQRRGLHPGFGALHSPADRAAACVYDLMEAFRAPLVEGLAVYLLNNRVLSAEMFAVSEQDGAVRLMPEGRRRLIRGWESWLDRPVKSQRSGHRLAWRRLMDEQVMALVRHVRGEEPYRPYLMDY